MAGRLVPAGLYFVTEFLTVFLIPRHSTPRFQSALAILCSGYSGVPLIHTNLSTVLPLFQTVIGTVIFHLGRSAVRFALGLLPVSPYLSAGALCLTWSNAVTVAGVVSSGEQKIFSAVVTAARHIPHSQPSVELHFQKAYQTRELRPFCQNNFVCARGETSWGQKLL